MHTSMREESKLNLLKEDLATNIEVPLTSMSFMSKCVGGSPETNNESEFHLNLHEASSSGLPIP